jgi:hypothetical protein
LLIVSSPQVVVLNMVFSKKCKNSNDYLSNPKQVVF